VLSATLERALYEVAKECQCKLFGLYQVDTFRLPSAYCLLLTPQASHKSSLLFILYGEKQSSKLFLFRVKDVELIREVQILGLAGVFGRSWKDKASKVVNIPDECADTVIADVVFSHVLPIGEPCLRRRKSTQSQPQGEQGGNIS